MVPSFPTFKLVQMSHPAIISAMTANSQNDEMAFGFILSAQSAKRAFRLMSVPK